MTGSSPSRVRPTPSEIRASSYSPTQQGNLIFCSFSSGFVHAQAEHSITPFSSLYTLLALPTLALLIWACHLRRVVHVRFWEVQRGVSAVEALLQLLGLS